MQVFIRIFPYVRRYPLLAFATLFCAIAGTLMVVVFPAITQRIVDQVAPAQRIVVLTPYRIRQQFVGGLCLTETCRGIRRRIAVGMKVARRVAVCRLDLVRRCARGEAQGVVGILHRALR